MSAVFSDCGTYRYALVRDGWLGEGTVLFVMLNPSTADADTDDQTVRRCIDFAQRWGFARLVVANLYAYRATDPRDLGDAAGAGVDPIGPQNDVWLAKLSKASTDIVVAWGGKAERDRERQVLDMLGPGVACLGQTKSGAPLHPLYLAKSTPRRALESA